MPSSRTATTLLAIAALIVTFFIGAVAGAVIHRAIMLHWSGGPLSERSAEFLMKRLDRRLDLNATQEKQVTEILRAGHERIRGVWSNVAPQVHAEIERTNGEIEKILTPEQRRKFDTIKMKMQPHRDGRGIRLRHD